MRIINPKVLIIKSLIQVLYCRMNKWCFIYQHTVVEFDVYLTDVDALASSYSREKGKGE